MHDCLNNIKKDYSVGKKKRSTSFLNRAYMYNQNKLAHFLGTEKLSEGAILHVAEAF